MLFAADGDQADTRNLGQLLGQDAFRVVVDRRDRQRGGGQPENQDRRVGRVGLMVDRRRRHVLRQLAGRGVDRRLHKLRGGVDVVVQRELQDDGGVAKRTG